MLSHALNAEVINNLIKVPPPRYKNQAYFDLALPLKYSQIISQPCIVELIIQIAKLRKMGLPCIEFSLLEVNGLTKNKNEALGSKIIPEVRFVTMTGGVPK